MMKPNRRQFIQSVAGGFAIAAAAAGARPVKAAASDRVRHGVIGLGSQGRNHARSFAALPDCDVVAVCDVDPERRAQTLDELKSTDTKAVAHYADILNDASIDSVSIATPDHWHVPIALAALDAGKHVYVEKPCCHNVHEGHVLAAAATKTGKCVQHGTQSRSSAGIKEGVKFLQEGKLGKVRLAKAINHQLRPPIGRAPVGEPPPGVDYDLWIGPAPEHPFTQNRWHYNWHWFWAYGTGDMGNDGVHQLDVARWGLGVGIPETVIASGGQLFYDDDHETPDTQLVTFDYGDKQLVYEMRLWTDYPLEGHNNGVVFYGDNGRMDIGRNGVEVTMKGEPTQKIGDGADIEENFRNFVACVKTEEPAGLNAPISEGVASATLCHFGNIGTRLGRMLHFDPRSGKFEGDKEATRMLARTYRKGYELPDVS